MKLPDAARDAQFERTVRSNTQRLPFGDGLIRKTQRDLPPLEGMMTHPLITKRSKPFAPELFQHRAEFTEHGCKQGAAAHVNTRLRGIRRWHSDGFACVSGQTHVETDADHRGARARRIAHKFDQDPAKLCGFTGLIQKDVVRPFHPDAFRA